MDIKEVYRLVSHITRTTKRAQFLQLKSQAYYFISKMNEPLSDLAKMESTDRNVKRLYSAGYKLSFEIYSDPLGMHKIWACRVFSKKTGLHLFSYETTEDVIETMKSIYGEMK